MRGGPWTILLKLNDGKDETHKPSLQTAASEGPDADTLNRHRETNVAGMYRSVVRGEARSVRWRLLVGVCAVTATGRGHVSPT